MFRGSVMRKAAILGIFCLLLGAQVLVFEKESLYNSIRVVDTYPFRTLYFNRYPQSRVDLRNPDRGHFEYVEYARLLQVFRPQADRVAVLGLGGGSVSRLFLRLSPKIRVDSVEIDPWVAEVARRYFFVQENARHKIHIQDARQFLRKSRNRYDAIFVDAYLADYYGSYIPYHLATREFFRLLRNHLKPGGLALYNIIGTVDGWQNLLVRAMFKTAASEFPAVYLFPMRTIRNVILLAIHDTRYPRDPQRLWRALPRPLPPLLTNLLQSLWTRPLPMEGVPLLTDDYAPVEILAYFRGRR